MTYEEAVDRVEYMVSVHCNDNACDWDCDECTEAMSKAFEVFKLVNKYGGIESVKRACEKQIPNGAKSIYEEKGHFYLDEYGYCRCIKSDKNIRYPSISFEDLDYCPRCGQRLE